MNSKKYTFNDVIFFSNKHKMTVKNEQGEKVGAIVRAYDNESYTGNDRIRKGTFYAFENMDGEILTSIVVNRQGMKSILGYKYEFYDYKKAVRYDLHDVKWAIYLYFHMKGTINDHFFEAHEDWDGKFVLLLDKKKYAEVAFDEWTFNVTIEILDEVDKGFTSPAFIAQIYCMYRLYSIESKVVEEIISNIT